MKYIKSAFLALFVFVVGIIAVNASPYTSEDVPTNSYVIGTHLFNTEHVLTMQDIMIAAKTIDGESLEDMIIYYKDIYGNWIDATTGNPIEFPETVDIQFVNLVELNPNLIIKFNSNGGSGTMQDQTITYSGKLFKEWNTASDGSGSKYTDGQTITNNGNIGIKLTLYAIWQPAYGDVNLDGTVDFKDVTTLRRYIKGTLELSENALINADVNLDNKVDTKDPYLITKD